MASLAEVELGVVTGFAVIGSSEQDELLSLLLPLKLAHYAKALDTIGFSASTACVTTSSELEAVGLKPLEAKLLLAAARDAYAASGATFEASTVLVPPGQEVCSLLSACLTQRVFSRAHAAGVGRGAAAAGSQVEAGTAHHSRQAGANALRLHRRPAGGIQRGRHSGAAGGAGRAGGRRRERSESGKHSR